MNPQKTAEVNIEDTFADTNLEIEEIESTIKIICYALETQKYNRLDIKDIDSTLFMLQGKLNCIKNNLRIIKDCINIKY